MKKLSAPTGKYSTLLILTALTGGCGSMSHKKDDQALSQVKKAAVAGFLSDQPASNTLGLNLFSGKTETEAGGSLLSQKSLAVDQMLEALQEAFSKNMSWSVSKKDVMLKNPGYQSAYHECMDGIQSKTPPGQGLNRYLVDKVMDYDCARILKRSGRNQLMKDLGVDAIAFAKVDVHLAGATVMGFGARHPQAYLAFAVYSLNAEDPIWFEGQIIGEESKESVGSTGFTDDAATARLALASAKTAFARIGKGEQ